MTGVEEGLIGDERKRGCGMPKGATGIISKVNGWVWISINYWDLKQAIVKQLVCPYVLGMGHKNSHRDMVSDPCKSRMANVHSDEHE